MTFVANEYEHARSFEPMISPEWVSWAILAYQEQFIQPARRLKEPISLEEGTRRFWAYEPVARNSYSAEAVAQLAEAGIEVAEHQRSRRKEDA